MAKREQGMKGIFEGDDRDPAAKKMKELKAKVESQQNAPLYDEEDAAHYRNLNDRAVEAPEVEELEVPDYQSIQKSSE
jgi:hypothetical protein